jgi:tripartite-type tricarboxylate transporter receptor subunit TctC
MTRRRPLLAAAALSLLGPAQAMIPAWPTGPVRLVVPAPAGSSLDVIGRLLAERLGRSTGWSGTVVVDNKAGAGGLIGMDAVAKAPPNGQMLALGFNGPVAFAPHLYRRMPYDPAKDLAPVVMTTLQPNVLAVSARLPVKTLQDFIAHGRQHAGRMNVASVGLGSASHLTMELLMAEGRFTATHVPYNGSPPAAQSVAQGDTDALFAAAPALLPLVRSGHLRLIAVSSRDRFAALPELPGMAEGGLPGIDALVWNGLFVAAGTPAGVVDGINADINAALREPLLRAALHDQGLAVGGGSAEAFRQRVDADSRHWGAVIRRIGLTLEA